LRLLAELIVSWRLPPLCGNFWATVDERVNCWQLRMPRKTPSSQAIQPASQPTIQPAGGGDNAEWRYLLKQTWVECGSPILIWPWAKV